MRLLSGIEAIVTDIEGTTTPIDFVYQTLFPFARARLEQTCSRAHDDPRLRQALATLRAEFALEQGGADPAFGDGSRFAAALMDRDRKSTGLKALQGLIWEEGYRAGELRAELFADVPPALERWRDRGLRLRVFSSGSVLAQRLLFAHTGSGDLTSLFEGFHDTTTGAKGQAASYEAIAAVAGLTPATMLYLSDVVAELDAAREAGMRCALLERPGNPSQPYSRHPAVPDFDAIG
jgi:enolase-phosphatase E1